MGGEGVSHSYMVISEHITDEAKETNNCDIGLLLQLKVESAEREIEELKRRRSEAAKANERVLGIFATHEQRWFAERNNLRLQIDSLKNKLKIVEMKKYESVSKQNEQLESKDKMTMEVEDKLIKAERIANELRETAKHEAKQHSAEIWKHKTAFFELVSAQRQLESEMARLVRQVEAYKQEIVKMQNDLEQKDQMFSAVLRKSKLGTTDKQMLVKEIKLSKHKSNAVHEESLECKLTLLKQDNTKLKALLLDQETELHSLKVQLKSQNIHLDSPIQEQTIITHDSILSEFTVRKREWSGHEEKEIRSVQQSEETLIRNQTKDIYLKTQSSEGEVKEEEASQEIVFSKEERVSSKDVEASECVTKKMKSLQKMDIHGVGVSYKIKRLKQQLLMFEKLNQEIRSENTQVDPFLVSLLNKQISRYLSVNEKTNDLCKRMHDNVYDIKHGDPGAERRQEESSKLEVFLEETFQLQRHIVATGQKLREIQSKTTADCCGSKSYFDMQKFGNGITNLLKDVQRGLEIRISHIIGDLEGTLACQGIMLHLQIK